MAAPLLTRHCGRLPAPCPSPSPCRDYSKLLESKGEPPLSVRRCETVEEVLREADVSVVLCRLCRESWYIPAVIGAWVAMARAEPLPAQPITVAPTQQPALFADAGGVPALQPGRQPAPPHQRPASH